MGFTFTFPVQLLPDSIACRLYVITVLVETTVDLVIEGDILLRFHEADKQLTQSSQPDNIATASKKMPVYLSVFALAQWVQSIQIFVSSTQMYCSLFQLGMALDAVYARNTLQFLALT
jgi:hypothetical protein